MKRFGIALLAGILLFFGFACSPKPVEVPSPTLVQEINGLIGLTLTMQNDTYYLDSAELVAILVNDTEKPITYGEASFLELKNGDLWERVPFKEGVAFDAIAHILKPGEQSEVVFSLGLFSGLRAGYYRLIKEVYLEDGNRRALAAAEFFIVDIPAEHTEAPEKPAIYLYPQEETEVIVQLRFDGTLTCTYPAYRDGWHVNAQPDGTLTDAADGREYSYLFWEGFGDAQYDFSSGFVVKGADTMTFLQEKLAALGLTPKEYNEFIVYWLPRMQGNAYNLISFQQEAYTKHAELMMIPRPDSILRVFMAYKALSEPVELPEQQLPSFERKGFTVVEWGGAESFSKGALQ